MNSKILSLAIASTLVLPLLLSETALAAQPSYSQAQGVKTYHSTVKPHQTLADRDHGHDRDDDGDDRDDDRDDDRGDRDGRDGRDD